RDAGARLCRVALEHTAKFLAGFMIAGLVAYIPLALVFGPWSWVQSGPFSFQLSRPLHYTLYFFAGVAIGACGIERGLIATDAWLARRWAWWCLAAPLLFALWIGLTAATMVHQEAASRGLLDIAVLSFAVAYFDNFFFALND